MTWTVTDHGWTADAGEFLLLVCPTEGRWSWEVMATDAWFDEGGWARDQAEAQRAAEAALARMLPDREFP